MPRDNNGVVGSGYGTSYCAVDCVLWSVVDGSDLGFGCARSLYFCFGELILVWDGVAGACLLLLSPSCSRLSFYPQCAVLCTCQHGHQLCTYIGHTSNNTFELRQ